ncbi:hypothetical protein OX284_005230 [Flavobacterium sp. SUN046]|uniref:hypothetical protein n=1 Tax=Flavobacterium sp. SUN046 TaxID=3002440 RepID=UPI002DBAD89A|nr:hypothetical protein [Flavobacterium sp. SUN046]MEC4048821.1 hypothetical protein [Flavobacterium sp. SUN046]
MDLIQYHPNLLSKKILLSELDINPRLYKSWKDEGVILYKNVDDDLSITSNKRKWVYLDVFEALWLLIVVELRKLNLDLRTIITLKEFLIEIPDYKSVFEDITEEEYENKILSLLPEEMLLSIKDISKKDFITLIDQSVNNNNNMFCSILGNLLFAVLINNTTPSIIIKLNPEEDQFDFSIAVNNHPNMEVKQELYNFYSDVFSNHVLINLPILPIVSKLFENEKLVNHCENYGFFTKQEKQLFEAINNNECREINIVKHNSGDWTINLLNEKSINGDQAKKLRKALGLKAYEKVEVIFRNDNHLVIKNKNKIISKKP